MTIFRYKIVIEYDGSDFVGWQRQHNGISIQQLIEEAIYKFSGQEVEVFASGRTDAGVHAKGQVGHFDLSKSYPPQTIMGAINFHLRPHPIVIIDAQTTSLEFHARFSAQKRYYRYVIANRPAPLALDVKRAWHVFKPLNFIKMQEAARLLEGTHDFTSFRASQCQAKSPIKTLDYINITKTEEHMIFIDLAAKSFLHHMVRNIAGTLKMVGEEALNVEDVARILEAKNRSEAGITAPAHGLYFMATDY